MRLDSRDKQIIFELSRDASVSVSLLAKRMRISRQLASYKINSLRRSKVIKSFVSIINTDKLGYTSYSVRLKLSDAFAENNLVSYLKSHHNVIWFASCLGSWDFIFEIFVKEIIDFDDFIKEIMQNFGEVISDYEYSIIKKVMIKPAFDKSFSFSERGICRDKINIDSEDFLVLNTLSNNARMNISEISKNTGLSYDVVRYRTRKLFSNGLLLGSTAKIDFKALNYGFYFVLVNCRNFTVDNEKRIMNYLKMQDNVVFVVNYAGESVIEINTFLRDSSELKEFILNLEKNFQGVIKNCESLLILEEHKDQYIPSNI